MKDAILLTPTTIIADSKLFFVVSGNELLPPDHPKFDTNNEDWYYENDTFDVRISTKL